MIPVGNAPVVENTTISLSVNPWFARVITAGDAMVIVGFPKIVELFRASRTRPSIVVDAGIPPAIIAPCN